MTSLIDDVRTVFGGESTELYEFSPHATLYVFIGAFVFYIFTCKSLTTIVITTIAIRYKCACLKQYT